MDAQLRRIASTQHGVFLRRQALDLGYDDAEISRLRSRRIWVAARRGAYMDAADWGALDDLGRHRALAHAVMLQLSEPAVLSHVSAAVVLGLPVWDVDLSVVHVTRVSRHSPRMEAGVHHHAGDLPQSDILVVSGGLLATSPARTAVDMARTLPFEPAVVTADGALARADVADDDLRQVFDRMRDWQGARSAGRVVAFADGRSESIGESRHRVQLDRIGLPAPDLQVAIRGSAREDRVDFYFGDYTTVGEFDGRQKYGRLLRAGESAGDAAWREKVREDRLREGGFQVVRTTWADLYRDEVVARRYRRAFRRSFTARRAA